MPHSSEDQISQLAKKHRSKKRRTEELAKTNTPVAKDGDKKILIDSFAPKSDLNESVELIALTFLVLGICWAPVLLIPGLKEIIFGEALPLLSFLGLTVVMMVILATQKRKWSTKLGIRRLKKIKYFLNVDEYIQQLSQARINGKLEMELNFSTAWTDNRQTEVADAIREIIQEVKEVTWINGTKLNLLFGFDGGTGSARGRQNGDLYHYYTNVRFQRRFRQLYKKVIPMLNNASPISSMTVCINGDVVSPEREI